MVRVGTWLLICLYKLLLVLIWITHGWLYVLYSFLPHFQLYAVFITQEGKPPHLWYCASSQLEVSNPSPFYFLLGFLASDLVFSSSVAKVWVYIKNPTKLHIQNSTSVLKIYHSITLIMYSISIDILYNPPPTQHNILPIYISLTTNRT